MGGLRESAPDIPSGARWLVLGPDGRINLDIEAAQVLRAWVATSGSTAERSPQLTFRRPSPAFFYRRHLLMIVGISLIASAQRVVAVLWSEQLPAALNVVLETVTMGVRVLLFVLIVRLVFFRDRGARAIEDNGWAGARAFMLTRWPSLIVQVLMVAGLTVVFDLIPDQLIGPRIPEDMAGAYWAALLAVKNPTIIAFTMVWFVVAARQMTLYPQPLPARASHDAAGGQPRPVGTRVR